MGAQQLHAGFAVFACATVFCTAVLHIYDDFFGTIRPAGFPAEYADYSGGFSGRAQLASGLYAEAAGAPERSFGYAGFVGSDVLAFVFC